MTLNAVVYSPIRLFADGLCRCLEGRPETVAVPCHTIRHLSALLDEGGVDLLLYDVTDVEGALAASVPILASPCLCAVALALPEVLDQVIAFAELGFTNYLRRDAGLDDLWTTIDAALREEAVCNPVVTGGLLREIRRRAAGSAEAAAALTVREREVIGYLARGLTNKEIAREMGLSSATIKNHVHSILTKTNLHKRMEVQWSRQCIVSLQARPKRRLDGAS